MPKLKKNGHNLKFSYSVRNNGFFFDHFGANIEIRFEIKCSDNFRLLEQCGRIFSFYPVCSFVSHCLKITQNVAFEFMNFGILHQFLTF